MHAPETWGFVQFSENIVGTEKSEFVFNEIENVKWEMRKIYYAQHDYKMNHGKFTNDFNLLNLKAEFDLSKYNWPPKINTTDYQFEAILESKNGNTKIIIYDDSLIKVIKD